MRILAKVVLFAIATLGVANAFEGVEDQVIQAVGRGFLNRNCEPVRALMGADPYFQGHYERCLGAVARLKGLEAKNAGNTSAMQQHERATCEHYKRAIALWQQRPLPTHGTEKDVQSRRRMLEELIKTDKEKC